MRILSNIILFIAVLNSINIRAQVTDMNNYEARVNNIEISYNSILNKLDSCCTNKKKIKIPNTTKIEVKSSSNLKVELDLALKKIDSIKLAISLRLDTCCQEHEFSSNTTIETEKKEIVFCSCSILTIAPIVFILLIVIFFAYKLLNKQERTIFLKDNINKVLPQLPFLIIVWTIGICLFQRTYFEVLNDQNERVNYVKVVLLFTSIALLLLPFLKSVRIGKYLQLERNIKETKEEVKDFKTEFRNSFQVLSSSITNSISNINNQVNTVNNNYGFGPPPPDSKLPDLETEIYRLIKSKLKEHGINDNNYFNRFEVPEDNLNLFIVRYKIETEIRHIWRQRFEDFNDSYGRRHLSLIRLIQDLMKYEIIDNNFYGILKEILSICNYAIHGEKVTKNQVSFVEKNAKYVLEYLKDVK